MAATKLTSRNFMNLVKTAPNDEVHLEDYETTYADELETRWKDFVQRVRVHEMLKCLQSHHERLKVLRQHTDLDDILVAKQLNAEGHDVTKKWAAADDEEEEQDGETINKEELDEQTRLEMEEEERVRKEIEKKNDEVMEKGLDTLFLRTQAEEEEAITQIYPPLKKILADPKYVAKCAAKMFRMRSDITEQEFQAIIELCDDRLEKQALRDAYEENKYRTKYLHNADERRKMLYEFINSRIFVQFMLVTIIVSIVGIFLLTFESVYITYAYPLIVMDNCIVGIFVVEATFKLIIYKEDYFKQPWNILDILIIVVNFVEVSVELITKTLALSTDINANIYFKVLKSLRALRLLCIIKFLPNLQVIVTTVFQSMLSLGSIAVLMILFMFVFAVMGRGLFSEDSPNNFGGIWLAFVTLFQLLTMDDWFQLLQFFPQGDENPQYWIMFFYLFFYLVIENFVFLNLFVAVLVDNFQLTLAATEIRKQKEALIYLEENENFDDMFEQLDTKIPESHEADKDHYVDPTKPEMRVPDYFHVSPESREEALLEHIFKDLCSLDFERFLWNRRLCILHTIMDTAITVHRNSWAIQDNHDEVELGRLGAVQSS